MAGQPEIRTLVDLIDRSSTLHADRTALTLRGREGRHSWTYRELGDWAGRFAAYLHVRSIGPGDRVMLWAANQPWWAGAFYGCQKAGVVVVPLDARGSADFTRRVGELTRPSLIVGGPDQLSALGESAISTVAIGELDNLVPGEADGPSHRPDPDELAEIVFTSGTTGEPKGVMISHRNLIATLLSMDEHVKALPSYRLLSVLPLSHLFEQSVGLFDLTLAGASAVYVQTLQPSSIFEALADEQITLMLAVPQVLSLFYDGIEREVRRTGKERAWRILHRVGKRTPFPLRRHLFRTVHKRMGGAFEFFFVGGAYLDPQLAQKWETMGVKVVQGYGLTECSPGVAATSLEHRKLDSVGKPISCCEVKLAEDGEVLVRGPNVTAGYWENPSATEEAFRDGWYCTGDIGRFDAEGYLYLMGRKKNIIVLANGMNVYPEDVENALVADPAVKDAVVIGLRRGQADVDVHAVLLLEDPSKAPDVVRTANRHLASHQHIQGWTIWPEPDFPRTPTLKAKRAPIVERVGSGAAL